MKLNPELDSIQSSLNHLMKRKDEIGLINFMSGLTSEKITAMRWKGNLTLLHKAVNLNLKSTVTFLIGLTPIEYWITKDRDAFSALHHAIRKDNAEILTLLLNNLSPPLLKSELNFLNKKGQTPFHLAAKHKKSDCISVLEKFIEFRTETQTQVSIYSFMKSKDQVELIKLLKEVPIADICKIQWKGGRTLLHRAVSLNLKEVVAYLLEVTDKAYWILKDRQDSSAIHYAAKHGHSEILHLLLKALELLEEKEKYQTLKSEINFSNTEGYSPLYLAIIENKSDCVKIFEKFSQVLDFASFKFPPLHFAIWKDRTEIAEILLRMSPQESILARVSRIEGGDLNTALHLAARKNNSRIILPLLDYFSRLNRTSKLLSSVDGNDNTALFVAAIEGKIEFLEELISQVPDIVKQSHPKTKSTIISVLLQNKQTAIALKCLKYVDVNQTDTDGNSLLHLFLQHKIPYTEFEDLFKIVSKATLIGVNKKGKTAVHIALENNLRNHTMLLLNEMPSDQLASSDLENNSILSLCIEKKFYNAVELLLSKNPRIQMEIKPDPEENTPLHLAIQKKDLAMVSLLLPTCADDAFYTQNCYEHTLLDLAIIINSKEMLALLLPHAKKSIEDKKTRIKFELVMAYPGDDMFHSLLAYATLENLKHFPIDEAGNNLLTWLILKRHPLFKSVAEKFPALIFERNSQGNSALHVAAEQNNYECLFDLFKQKDIKDGFYLKNNEDKTALQVALETKNENISQLFFNLMSAQEISECDPDGDNSLEASIYPVKFF